MKNESTKLNAQRRLGAAPLVGVCAGRVDMVNGKAIHTSLYPFTFLPKKALDIIVNHIRALVTKWKCDRKYADPSVIRYEAEKLCVNIMQGNLIIEEKGIIPYASAVISKRPRLLSLRKGRRASGDSNNKHVFHKRKTPNVSSSGTAAERDVEMKVCRTNS